MATAHDILKFWLDEVGPEGWYSGGEALDQMCRDRFADDYRRAYDGSLSLWLTYPSGALAYIILTDQLPRNMFRDEPEAFDTDTIAKAAAKASISKNWDLRIDPPARQFFYMPLMHSECLEDQERCVRLFKTRMNDGDNSNLLHARAHREIIRRFGRFSTRNAALGRTNSDAEQAYLDEGGYGAIVRKLQEKEPA